MNIQLVGGFFTKKLLAVLLNYFFYSNVFYRISHVQTESSDLNFKRQNVDGKYQFVLHKWDHQSSGNLHHRSFLWSENKLSSNRYSSHLNYAAKRS